MLQQSESQARSQGGEGGATQPPHLPKGPLLATKWTKSGVFEGGLRWVRFKKSTFGVQKVHFWGVPHHPKIDSAYGRACRIVINIDNWTAQNMRIMIYIYMNHIEKDRILTLKLQMIDVYNKKHDMGHVIYI